MQILPPLANSRLIQNIRGDERPGLYDVTSIKVIGGEVYPGQKLSRLGSVLFDLFANSLRGSDIDIEQFNSGGAYYRIIDGSNYDSVTDRGGVFHYDTGLSVPLVVENPARRFITAFTTSYEPIQTVFSQNPEYVGLYAGDVLEGPRDALVQPPNGVFVEFDEGQDLHARLPRGPWVDGEVAVFASLVLRSSETEVISCPALVHSL